MLALVVTLFFALYILGPDLVSRWVLGFVVQRRSLTQSKSEEITRAVIWTVVPLAIAYLWAGRWGNLWRCGGFGDLGNVFSGIYSESFFKDNRSLFFQATRKVFWMNYCILWRLYLTVLLGSLGLNAIIVFYGRIRHALRKHPRCRTILTTFVAPRVSEWHLLLSEMLLPSKHLHLRIDILTKGDRMYQGRLANRQLATDGSLVSITLEEPRRFKRDEYIAAVKAASEKVATKPSEALNAHPPEASAKISPDSYWKVIPGNMFIIMADDISTLNLRYTPNTIQSWFLRNNEDLKRAIARLSEGLNPRPRPKNPRER